MMIAIIVGTPGSVFKNAKKRLKKIRGRTQQKSDRILRRILEN